MAEAASVGDGDAEEINRDGDGVGGIGGRGDWAKSAVGRNNPIQQARPPRKPRPIFPGGRRLLSSNMANRVIFKEMS